MVIMRNYFNFSRRGLLGSVLATSAAWTIGGPDFAVAAPVRRAAPTLPQTLTAAGRPRAVQAPGFRIHISASAGPARRPPASSGCATPTGGGTGDR